MKKNFHQKAYDVLVLEQTEPEVSVSKFDMEIKEELVYAHCRPAFRGHQGAWLATETARELMKLSIEELDAPGLRFYAYGMWDDYLDDRAHRQQYNDDMQFILEYEKPFLIF